MTNEWLDGWIAEKVMGLKICDDPDCEGCDSLAFYSDGTTWTYREYDHLKWSPTSDIAQAIGAAEKARLDGRIDTWMLQPGAARVEVPKPPGAGGLLLPFLVKNATGTPAESICRALYEALRENP